MIGIFNNKTTKADLTLYNGEYILDTVCTSYEITEELNGEYSFDGTFLISDKINKNAYDLLVNDSLLKVDDEYGIEYFRIAKVTKTKTKYEIFARHITISEPLKMFCEDVRPTNLNGQGAISWIFDNSRGNKWIEVTSDITNVNTAYYKNKTVYEALFDSDNSFLTRWGGEVYRRGFRLSINTKVGEDRGVSIRSGKNLKGIEERSSLNTLVTSIYPVGFDGISIPEKCIDSPLINYYSDIYPKEVKFDDVKVKSENSEEGFNTLEQAQEELRKRAKEMFTKDKVDILTSSYTVTFAELQKAEGYKNYSFLETTFLGDIVSVYEEKLGIDIKVRVTKRVYDGIKKRRKSTTLSNKDLNYKPPSITQIVEKLNKVDSTETVLNLAKEQATALIKSGLKNSYVIVKANEIIIGDTKDINTMTKVWRWNNGGLGFSSTGYYGEFGTAITQDGAIVADFITTGILNAALIKTGLIQSLNENLTINMDTGEVTFKKGLITSPNMDIDITNGNIETRTNGNKALSILGRNINFYDWQGTARAEPVGKVFSARKLSDNGQNEIVGLSIGSEVDSYLGVSYAKSDGLYYDYILFDKYGVNGLGSSYPIWFQENVIFNVNSMALRNKSTKKYIEMFLSNNNVFVTEISTSVAGEGYQIQSASGSVLFAIKAGGNYPITLNTSTQIGGNLSVTGSKNSLQKTENYGERLINAYETAEYYFGDIGSGIIKEGECIIWIDDILKECVNTDIEYHVFIQTYNGKVNKIERYKEYFIVYGEDNTEFSWELKAKRKGYENVRLDTPEMGTIEDITTFTDKDLETNTSEDILLKELNFKLEDILMGVE